MKDLRDNIFKKINGKRADAVILANGEGLIAGTDRAASEAVRMGLTVKNLLDAGSHVKLGDIIGHFNGPVKEIIMGEDYLIGYIGKPSGIATAAYAFAQAAGDKPRVVSGGWKKMPFEVKEAIRKGVVAGGVSIRITDRPFIYLDKNYIEVFGGIKACLTAVAHLKGFLKVVQLKGKYNDISDEALEAARLGADILFIDTGKIDDLYQVNDEIRKVGWRDKVEIAFGGNILLEEIEELKSADVDILDVGRAIIDAPLLDLKYEVRINSDDDILEGFSLAGVKDYF